MTPDEIQEFKEKQLAETTSVLMDETKPDGQLNKQFAFRVSEYVVMPPNDILAIYENALEDRKQKEVSAIT